jgi:hypothetical protein
VLETVGVEDILGIRENYREFLSGNLQIDCLKT